MFDDLQKIDTGQKPEVKKEENPEENPKEKNPKERIYVMPKNFVPKAKKKKKTNKFTIIIIAISVLIVISLIATGFFVFKKLWDEAEKKELKTEETIPSSIIDQDASQTKDIDHEVDQEIFSEQVFTEEFTEQTGGLKKTAKLIIPDGAAEKDLKVKITAYAKELYQGLDPQTQIFGPVYFLESEKINLSESASLALSYDQQDLLANEKQVEDLKIACLKNDKWQFLDGQIDEQNNVISVDLNELENSFYTIAISLADESGEQDNGSISVLDSDKDGLTDEEEKIYRTNIFSQDTDADGYSDMEEIVNLFSPISMDGELRNSGLVNLYTNPVFQYNLFYPANWLAQALDISNGSVIFTSATGEFIEVLVLENPSELTASQWYEEQVFSETEVDIKNTIVAGQQAIEIIGLEGQKIVYFAFQDKIYGLIYNYGDKAESNFEATFEMMKNSFTL